MKKHLLFFALLFVYIGNAQVPSYVPTNGLVGYWPFSGNANDASSNGNNGTVNGATLTADRFGNQNSAYSFNGTSNYIRCLNSGVTGSNSRSFAFWVKTSSTSPGSIISYGNNDTPNQDFRVVLNGITFCGTNYIACTITGSGIFAQYAPNSNWDFFTIVYDNASSTNLANIKIYKNGILYTSLCNENTTNTLNTSSTNPLTFGCYHWLNYSGNKQYFSGILDDFGTWNRALTQSEITGLYTTLGTEQIPANNQITIYPNPAKEQITIDLGTNSNIVGGNYKIINTLGQEVLNGVLSSQQNNIQLNNVKGQGIYFVKIYDNSKNLIKTKKIIIQQ